MPVPIPGPKVGYDTQKVQFLMISGRPKTAFFLRFLGVPAKLIINNVPKGSYAKDTLLRRAVRHEPKCREQKYTQVERLGDARVP